MPIPSPSEEDKSSFISKCMGDNVMKKEYSDQKQRAAVCHSKWSKAKGTIEIDLTEQVVRYYEDFDCGNCSEIFDTACPRCKCLPCICGSRASEDAAKHKSGYPGENVKRRKDGVPAKKKKKRATKKGEHRDKNGKLKKTKGKYAELWKKVNR